MLRSPFCAGNQLKNFICIQIIEGNNIRDFLFAQGNSTGFIEHNYIQLTRTFQHSAVSEKNARGLGQILYPTGSQAGKELAKSLTFFRHVSKNKLDSLREEDLLDPAINILLTCYLIAKYNYRFDGRLDLVVSAWNAGENTESLSFGQHAPYRETEDLIGKINAYYIYLLKTRKFQK